MRKGGKERTGEGGGKGGGDRSGVEGDVNRRRVSGGRRHRRRAHRLPGRARRRRRLRGPDGGEAFKLPQVAVSATNCIFGLGRCGGGGPRHAAGGHHRLRARARRRRRHRRPPLHPTCRPHHLVNTTGVMVLRCEGVCHPVHGMGLLGATGVSPHTMAQAHPVAPSTSWCGASRCPWVPLDATFHVQAALGTTDWMCASDRVPKDSAATR